MKKHVFLIMLLLLMLIASCKSSKDLTGKAVSSYTDKDIESIAVDFVKDHVKFYVKGENEILPTVKHSIVEVYEQGNFKVVELMIESIPAGTSKEDIKEGYFRVYVNPYTGEVEKLEQVKLNASSLIYQQ